MIVHGISATGIPPIMLASTPPYIPSTFPCFCTFFPPVDNNNPKDCWLNFSGVIRARLDCQAKQCGIIHMIVFSSKYLSDGIIRCLHCLSDVFIIIGNYNKIILNLENSIKKVN